MQSLSSPAILRMKLLVMFMMVAAVTPQQEQLTAEVQLPQGAILGYRDEAANGKVFYTFKNIPYGKPPTGDLRFKDPEPATGWSGVRNGSIDVPRCPQPNPQSFLAGNISVLGQEDCLYLIVHTPRPYTSNLPVMVYIHGGGFQIGKAGDYASPTPIMQKDVVVVEINYRLGSLGFLSTGDNVLPGNLGLKDQTLALRWVQDNIGVLGGDPQQVTAFGISAGSTSVHFHILSPESAGLFRRAIMQSGTALLTSDSKGAAVKMGKVLNCTGETSDKLLACFMEASTEDLLKAAYNISGWKNIETTLAPRVDGTFLPDHPATLLKEGRYNKVDLLTGVTRDDGNVISLGFFGQYGGKSLEELKNNFTKYGPLLLLFEGEDNPQYLAHRTTFHYMPDLNITRERVHSFTHLLGDRYFRVPTENLVEHLAKNSATHKTFLYELQHPGPVKLMSMVTNTTLGENMVGHGDDMLYLFDYHPVLNISMRPQDLHVRHIMVNLWTNFAATGNPTINGNLGFRWTPVAHGEDLQFLSITPSPSMRHTNRQHRDFWKSLPIKENKLLFPELFLEDMPQNTASSLTSRPDTRPCRP